MDWKCSKPYSWLFHTPTQKSILPQSSKFPTKSSKIPILPSQTTYRTPYRQNHYFSTISLTSTPKFQTSILPKITPTILFSSLYISVFTDNDFSIKSHTQESQPIGGVY
jgi:hypothetical protein